VPKDIPAKIRLTSAAKSIKSQFTIAKGFEGMELGVKVAGISEVKPD